MDWLLLVEACLAMAAAWVRLHGQPFSRLAPRLARPPGRRADGGSAERAIARVRWALHVLAEDGPLPFVCFPQAIAAQAMLRRRGVPAAIHYGVRKAADGRTEAHAWAMVGAKPVVGVSAARGFTVLTVFGPDQPE
jgi:hypothetical protein